MRERSAGPLCAEAHGFSLHAGVRSGAHQRKELERLCRYITRPAIANERLKRNGEGQVVLQLESAWRDGATHIVMSPWGIPAPGYDLPGQALMRRIDEFTLVQA